MPARLCDDAIPAGKYDQVRINFANPDMVGHTGDLAATVHACKLVDACVKVRSVHSASSVGACVCMCLPHPACKLVDACVKVRGSAAWSGRLRALARCAHVPTHARKPTRSGMHARTFAPPFHT